MQETPIQFLGQEDPLEKGKATHSRVLAWRMMACIVHGIAKSWTRLSNFHCHFLHWFQIVLTHHLTKGVGSLLLHPYLGVIFLLWNFLFYFWASLVAQTVKNPPALWETWVQPLSGKDPWKKAWQPTPVFLPGKSPWTDEPECNLKIY